MRNSRFTPGVAVIAALFFSSVMCAQPPKQPAVAKSPAAASQVPDLSGVWMQHPPASARSYAGYKFTKEEPPMTPWAEAKYHEAKPTFGPKGVAVEDSNSPDYNCLPPGVPYIYFRPHPFEMIQSPGHVIMYFEYDHFVREIFTDGRPHPSDLDPTWMGNSIGHYEGDTLVVDTIGFNDKTWLDRVGHPHSDQLHLVERFRRTNHDTLTDDITINDPKAYTRPWNAHLVFELKPTWNIGEFICEEMMYAGHK
ncbi:MAG TPA: hypothetical protein VNI36_11285 [Candidatus Dormibacteraeota bacterium]|nr:hypothetical protein [Candidatus Dormibacteraeota bacterium]